ncbi:MAG: hypothetical protein J2P25_16015 [Nocardiopsaceae bacterium]|nr:hypothetical protein [Nocardiopsaceae bacterium]
MTEEQPPKPTVAEAVERTRGQATADVSAADILSAIAGGRTRSRVPHPPLPYFIVGVPATSVPVSDPFARAELRQRAGAAPRRKAGRPEVGHSGRADEPER